MSPKTGYRRYPPELRESIYNRFIDTGNKKQTAREFNISPKNVRNIVNKFKKFHTFENLPKKPRSRVTDRHQDLNILREITNSPKKKPRDIKYSLNLSCSTRTISRRIKEIGLNPRVAATVPYVSKPNIRRRLILAKKQVRLPEDFWKRVIWSDEKKFELMNSRRRVIVYRRKGQRYNLKFVKPSVKHGGGSIMVWGCFSYHGMGALHLINGIMNGPVYRDILVDELQFSTDLMGVSEGFVFQQDLDPKHTSPAPTEFFRENGIEVLEWSPQSADISPIENLWAIFDWSVPLKERTSIPRFWAALQKTWYLMDSDFLKRLVLSVPGRYAEVIRAKNGPTGK